ncbi:MAG: tol-pal system protein YbgF [Pseudomonadota bacterium]
MTRFIVPLFGLLLVAAPDAMAQSDNAAANVARLELRIVELETQIRSMTGQIERLEFDLRQSNQRLDRALNDIEFRLTALEGGDPTALPQPSDGSAGAAAPASAEITSSADPAQPAGPQPGDSQILGTLTVAADGTTTQTVAAPEAQPATETASVPAAPANPEADVATRYNTAFALLQDRDFPGAEAAFSSFVEDYPDHPLASNARYWVGESLYARGQFTEAASSFALGYQQYPDGAKALDSLVKLGMTFAAMGQKQDACATFGQINREFPSAPQGVQRRIAQELDRLQCG